MTTYQKTVPVTSTQISDATRRYFSEQLYRVENTFVFGWESDVFFVTKTGLSVEIEIKVSKSDFKRDFAKQKHLLLKNHRSQSLTVPGYTGPYGDMYKDGMRYYNAQCCSIQFLDNEKLSQFIPHRFYFAMPLGLVYSSEIPPYAGVLWYCPEKKKIVDSRRAPQLHKAVQDHRQVLLDRHFYSQWKIKAENSDLRRENNRLKELLMQHEINPWQ